MTRPDSDGRQVYKILLVEDDQFKQELVEKAVRETVHEVDFSVSRSVQQAVEQLRAGPYDLIVLDISLPSHESRPGGAQPISQPSGGIEVLLELSYDLRNDKVVILTQYPEIEYDGKLYPLSRFQKAISETISANIAGVFLFNPKDSMWRDQLKRVLV